LFEALKDTFFIFNFSGKAFKSLLKLIVILNVKYQIGQKNAKEKYDVLFEWLYGLVH